MSDKNEEQYWGIKIRLSGMFATLASVLSYGIDPCNALAPRHLASVINPCLAIADSPAFNILPHPAKTNNPADLDSEPAAHGGLQSAGMNAYNAKGPHVVSDEVAKGLEEPKSREELEARAKELNE